MKSLFFFYFYSNKVTMDRFLLITFFCVNWSHLAFSQGRYNLMLFIISKAEGMNNNPDHYILLFFSCFTMDLYSKCLTR